MKKYIFRDADKPKSRKHPYVMISKTVINDKNLSPEEIGIMAVLLSNKNEWNQQVDALRIKLGISTDKLKKRLKHLKALGYVERNKKKAKDGTWIWETIVIEVPNRTGQKPSNSKPSTGTPEDGSPMADLPFDI